MKTTLILLVFYFFAPSFLFAQLDNMHWLPPMHSRDDNQISDHYLYLSTPHPDAFEVTITDGAGTVLATPTISAGAPFIYTIATDDPSVVMIEKTDLNTVLTGKGIIASAPEKFYCNFRARSNLQATSITCKGNAGRGQTFRVGSMPQQTENFMRNFTVGIMATENNTNVTISDYNTGVEFFDMAGNITDDELVFTLDSGECYVVSGYTDIAANLDGIVGALVSSDKPIVMNNGSWCGSISDAGGQDIGMDQSVPVEVIGDEYILIRGDGNEQMERPLVIAHYDGTEIFVNELPTAVATINAGEYFLIPEAHYSGIGHENMYVHTTEPAYVYQPLGGSPSRTTSGLNFIPPISCALTNEIDLIPAIDQIGSTTYNGAIMCFTLAGAEVRVNGDLQSGAQPVDGITGWETYKINGYTGDVQVTSTDRMAVGMFGFDGLAGFAGFYSGFDQIGFVDFSVIENCEYLPTEFTDETVTFIEEVIAWDWDFGDGETSTDQNPDHLYAESGTYDVILEITTNLGCTDTITYPVLVKNAPTASFSAPDRCLGEVAIFADESEFAEGLISEWGWDFGDLTLSEFADPTHTYVDFGTYTVTLTVTGDNGCEGTVTDEIAVFPLPFPSFVGLNSCHYDSSLFENLTIIPEGAVASYSWDFGDASSSSELVSPSHLYDTHGVYDVTLTAISDEGCVAETTGSITRFAAPETNFELSDICLYETLTPINSSEIDAPYIITGYDWDFGDGTVSSLEDPTKDFTDPGIYEVRLVSVSEEGCVDTMTQIVQVFDEPVADFSVEDGCIYETADFANLSSVTDGDLTAFAWTFGDETSSVLEAPSHTYTDVGLYTVTLEVVSEHGCVAETTGSITRFAAPETNFELSDSDICLYETLTLVNSSEIDAPYIISGYDWDFGDGTVSSLEDPTKDFTDPGVYEVRLVSVSEEGCVDSMTQIVQVFDKPVADFSVEDGCIYETADFVNLSSVTDGDLTAFAWTFGDETSSVLEAPSHTYMDVGIYTVTLEVVSEHGCVADTVLSVERFAVPEVAFTAENSCYYDSSFFENLTTIPEGAVASYSWDFGDASSSSELVSPSHLYDTHGVYDVTLTAISDEGCVAETTGSITRFAAPETNFELSDICLYETLTPINSSEIDAPYIISGYDWDFGDGTVSSLEDPTKDFTDPGTYEVRLVSVSEEGCVDTMTQIVQVFDEPVADFSVEDGCIYETADFVNLSSVTDGDLTDFAWTFGDETSSVLEAPSHTYMDVGIYTVTLEVVSEHGCVADTVLSVERFAAPEVAFTAENACLYDSLFFVNASSIEDPYTIAEYDWSFGDDEGSEFENPAHLFDEPGAYTVVLTATSENGCVSEMSAAVSVHPVPEIHFTAAPVCLNEGPSIFENISSVLWGDIDAWEWTFPDGETSSLENPTHYFDASGEHLVQLLAISDQGCIDSLEIPVLVRAFPFANFISDDPTICGNECIIFNSTSFSTEATITSLEWSTDFGHEASGETVELCFESYDLVESFFDIQLIVQDEYGCSDTLFTEDYINVLATPKAAFTTNPDEVDIINPEVNFVNMSVYASYYEWDFGDVSSTSNEINPTHTYGVEPQSYEVTLYAYNSSNQQCVDTEMKTVKILDKLIYYVPNAFTPDGNSVNNVFQPVFTSGFDPYDYHLSIYNRWGEVLFESHNKEVGWDGTYGDFELVQDGVYAWKIQFKERMTGSIIEDIGHVTLLK